jgi:ELWxxDGT repeat protein
MKRVVRGLAIAGLASVTTWIAAAELASTIIAGQESLARYAGDGSGQGVPYANGALWLMEDSAHGAELWFTNHTLAGTRRVRDIVPGPGGGGAAALTRLGNIVVFLAYTPATGVEWWRTDGTADGTFLLRDIGPGALSYNMVSNVPQVAVLDDVMYFVASDGVSGNELWRTDGTPAGTWLAADVVPGYESSTPSGLVASASHIFFISQGDPWVSDGTSAGTRRIVDLVDASGFVGTANAMFFVGRDEVHGSEPWRVDTDGQNPRMVENINSAPAGAGQDLSSYPSQLTPWNDSLIFVAQRALIPAVNGSASEPHLFCANASGIGATDLGALGTANVRSFISLPAGVLFSVGSDLSSQPAQLWITDGTPAGTGPLDVDGVSYSDPQSLRPDHFKVAYGTDGEAYFFGRQPGAAQPDKIWRTDGTRAGTRVFADVSTRSDRFEIAYFNGRVYFDTGAGSSPAGNELWTSDGTPAGTRLVRDLRPGILGSDITDLQVVSGRLQFFAATSSERQMWASDGTTDGTIALGAAPGTSRADAVIEFAGAIGSRVLFAATRSGASLDRELNISDGTPAGTAVIRDINTGSSADPSDFTALGDQVLFLATHFTHGRGLWRTDGTSGGTVEILDTSAGISTGNIDLGAPGSVLGGHAYFTANSSTGLSKLWRTDGTAGGTLEVTPGPNGQDATIIGGSGTHILYRASSTNAARLWSWNGSVAQVITAADGLTISAEHGVVLENRVCFRAWDVSPQRLDVWCASGSAGDLVRATNLATLGLTAGNVTTVGDKLLVEVSGGGATDGIYASDGTTVSTTRISAERMVRSQKFGSGQLVYAIDGGALRLTDGTSAGTRDLLQGATLPGSTTGSFGVLGNYVVFVVNDPQQGAVLWRTDGTVAGTRYLTDPDIAITPASAETIRFYTAGGRLWISSHRISSGTDLLYLNTTHPNASYDTATAVGGVAVTVDVLANDADFDGTLNATNVTIVRQPDNGTASVNATTGAITYTPSVSLSGMDSLTYQVKDNEGRNSNVATVTFQVTPGMPPPPPSPPPSSSGGKGGGALGIEIPALLLLIILHAIRLRRRTLAGKWDSSADDGTCRQS